MLHAKKQKYDLEELISMLSSENAKSKVIVRAVEKGIVSDPKSVNRTIKFYEKAQRFGDAARLAEEKGYTERADKYRTLADLLE